MLKVHAMALGAYQTNCYIIHDDASTSCCVIDPGYTPQVVLDYLEKQQLSVDAILLTHGHFDHVGGVKEIAAETGCKVYLCEADLSMPPMMTAGKLYYTDTYQDGDALSLSGLSIRVLHTPGHTPGSVCLVVENSIFSGDTLFQRSCGRTDLPGGDWDTICASLQRLGALEGNYFVHPGHGGATTLAEERRFNPYIRG